MDIASRQRRTQPVRRRATRHADGTSSVPTRPGIIADSRTACLEGRQPGLPVRTPWAWRDLIASDCSLCGQRSRGGCLCPGCEQDLMHDLAQRAVCTRCAGERDDLCLCPHCPDTGAVAAMQADGHDRWCVTCRLQPPVFDATVAGCLYTWPANRLIHQLKSRPSPAPAQALAKVLLQRLARPRVGALALPPDTVLVPIPSRFEALRERGFNPALRLAQALSARTHWPVRGRWLRRQRQAQDKPQHVLSRDERLRAAMGAHVCVPARCEYRTVALVDDVMTTGATLDDAARALRRAGAQTVVVLVAARTWV